MDVSLDSTPMICAHFTPDLSDDVLPAPPFLQNLVAILGDPDDVIAVVKNRVTAGVRHTQGLTTPWVRALLEKK